MIEQVVRLIYPHSLRQHPILNELIRTYIGLSVNILRADVSESSSWLELQFVGSAALIA